MEITRPREDSSDSSDSRPDSDSASISSFGSSLSSMPVYSFGSGPSRIPEYSSSIAGPSSLFTPSYESIARPSYSPTLDHSSILTTCSPSIPPTLKQRLDNASVARDWNSNFVRILMSDYRTIADKEGGHSSRIKEDKTYILYNYGKEYDGWLRHSSDVCVCPICFEAIFGVRKNTVVMGCGHLFHAICFSQYYLKWRFNTSPDRASTLSCPCCREEVKHVADFIRSPTSFFVRDFEAWRKGNYTSIILRN